VELARLAFGQGGVSPDGFVLEADLFLPQGPVSGPDEPIRPGWRWKWLMPGLASILRLVTLLERAWVGALRLGDEPMSHDNQERDRS